MLVALMALLAAIAARIAAPAPQNPVRYSAAFCCGSERWLVKTLQDRLRLLRAKASTVATLTGLTRPTPFQRHASRSSATSTAWSQP
jgi:hypothetical protein